MFTIVTCKKLSFMVLSLFAELCVVCLQISTVYSNFRNSRRDHVVFLFSFCWMVKPSRSYLLKSSLRARSRYGYWHLSAFDSRERNGVWEREGKTTAGRGLLTYHFIRMDRDVAFASKIVTHISANF